MGMQNPQDVGFRVSDAAKSAICFAPAFITHTDRTPEHILRVNIALNIYEALVIHAPEFLLPVGLVGRRLK